jgi:hypothetical protein
MIKEGWKWHLSAWIVNIFLKSQNVLLIRTVWTHLHMRNTMGAQSVEGHILELTNVVAVGGILLATM